MCAAPTHSGRGRPTQRPPRSAHAGPHLASTWPPARGACNGLLTRLPAPARVAVAVYGGTNEFMSQFMTQWGVEWTLVDATDPNEFVKAIRPNTKVTSGPASSRSCVACAGADRAHARVGSHPAPCHPLLPPSVPTHAPLTTRHHASPRVTTPHHPAPPLAKVVYTESPANPTCRLTDLEAVGALVTEWAQKTGNKKPWVMCDATFATPFHQRSLEIPGVDVAIHSATKCAPQ